MKYALISDVHSNLPALEAVLADIDSQEGVDAIYHLGDLVGYAPWPNEVVALIRERDIPGIAGNYDSTVATDYEHCGCKADSPRGEELAHLSFEWTKEHVTPETKRFLGAQPFRMDLRPRGGHKSRPQLLLVHGTPTLNTLYWTEDRPDSFASKMAKTAGLKEGDLIAFGHTHKPWYREVEGVGFVNAGSVGKPKDGDWRASYVLVEADEEIGPVEFVRLEYDLDRAVAGIHESELPDEFAEQLKAGGTPSRARPGKATRKEEGAMAKRKQKVLFLCTQNSARSQMAEGFLRELAGDRFEAYSAGCSPTEEIHPYAVEAMREVGIDISEQHPKGLRTYMGKMGFNYSIIVCARAEQDCPKTFPGVGTRLVWIFDDPRSEDVPEEEMLEKFREIRDEIELKIKDWLEHPEEELAKLRAEREKERRERLEVARREADERAQRLLGLAQDHQERQHSPVTSFVTTG